MKAEIPYPEITSDAREKLARAAREKHMNDLKTEAQIIRTRAKVLVPVERVETKKELL